MKLTCWNPCRANGGTLLFLTTVLLALGVAAVSPESAVAFFSHNNDWVERHLWSQGDVRHQQSSQVYRVTHDPRGPTFSHDYFNPNTRQLLQLVNSAHTSQILPKIKNALVAPENLKKGWLNGSLSEVDYTLARIVNHPKALALAAPLGKLLGRPNLPVKYYQRALKLYPQHAITHAQFGDFLIGIGEIDAGIKRLEIAQKVNPKLAVVYGWLAWAYHKKGDAEIAKKYIQIAKEKKFKGKLPPVK